MSKKYHAALTIAPMEAYDGDGWLCYDSENIGFGDTPFDAVESWQRGECISEHAKAKWAALGWL